MEKLSAILKELIRPEVNDWKIIKKAEGKSQYTQFNPLTLINSFLESEMDLEFSFELFDTVIPNLEKKAINEVLSYDDIRSAVIQCVLESNHEDAVFFVSNYDNIFGGDSSNVPSNNSYVNVRNASELKELIRHFVSNQLEDSHLESTDLTTITNRLVKLIRYCGFFYIDREFAYQFLFELSKNSTKNFLPKFHIDEPNVESIFVEAEKLFYLAKDAAGQAPSRAVNYLDMAIEQLSILLLLKFGLITAKPEKKKFLHLLEVIKLVLLLPQKNDPSFPQFKLINGEIEEILSGQGLSINDFFDTCRRTKDSLEDKYIKQSVEYAFDFLWYVKVIFNQNLQLPKLLSLEISEETASEYLSLLAEVVEHIYSNMYQIEKTKNCLSVQSNNSFHEINQFGRAFKIRAICGDLEDIDNYDFEVEIDSLDSNAESIPILIVTKGISGKFLKTLRAISSRYRRPIIPIRKSKLENYIKDNADIRDLFQDSLYEYIPSCKNWHKTVFEESGVHFPDNIDIRFKDTILAYLDLIENNSSSEAAALSVILFETYVREYCLFVYSYIKGLNKNSSTLLNHWPNDPKLNDFIQWFRRLNETFRSGKFGSEIRNLTPKESLIKSLHQVRLIRNAIIHGHKELEYYEVIQLINSVVKCYSDLVSLSGNYERCLLRIDAEKLIVKSTSRIIENENMNLIPGSNAIGFLRIDKAKSKPLLAYNYCTQCKSLSKTDRDVSVTGNFKCSSCTKTSSLSPLWTYFLRDISKRKYKVLDMSKSDDSKIDYLKVISEGVLTIAGPIGAPLKALLTLRDQKTKSDLNEKLDVLIKSNRRIEEELFSTYLAENSGSEEIISLATEVANNYITAVKSSGIRLGSPVEIKSIEWPYFSITSIYEASLVDELVRLYSTNHELLRADLLKTNFDLSRVKLTGTFFSDVQNIVYSLRSKSLEEVTTIFRNLSACNAGSEILHNVKNAFNTYSRANIIKHTD